MIRSPRSAGFTLIEMITVIAIIIILVSLVLAVNGLVQRKAAMTRTSAEIHTLSAGCESYKTDHGGYPQDTPTDSLDPTVSFSPTIMAGTGSYPQACTVLYAALSGDTNADGIIETSEQGNTNYAPDFFKSARIAGGTNTGVNVYMLDPYGNSYGYSTAGLLAQQEYQAALSTNPSAQLQTTQRTLNGVSTTVLMNSKGFAGFNNTFDLWSTGGSTSTLSTDVPKWVKNW